METLTATRELRLEIAHNVRHIGGYRTRTGRHTSPAVFRAASLHRLTPAGIEALSGAGITTIFDLRSTAEREKQQTPDLEAAGVSIVHAPVFETDASPVAVDAEFAGFATVYQRMLDTGAEAYRQLFVAIAEGEDNLLFHCAAGKDRTGVAAALLLELAGVAEDDIVADYALSERLLAPMYEQFMPAMKARGYSEARAAALLGAKEEDMADTLGFINGRWGSAEGYMTSIGLDEATISKLRGRMLV